MKRCAFFAFFLAVALMAANACALSGVSLSLPESLTEIGSEAFVNAGQIKSIYIPLSVTKIDERAFAGCGRDLIIYGPVGSYGQTWAEANGYAFVDCEADFSYEIARGEATLIKYLGNEKNVVIPDTLGGCPVTYVEDGAFAGATKLRTLFVPRSVTYIGICWYVFAESVPSVLTIRGYTNSYARSYATDEGIEFEPVDGTVKSGRYYYAVQNGEATIYGIDDRSTINFVTPKTLGGYPVTAIAPHAFDNAWVKSLTISEGVKTIGEGACQYMFAEAVSLPDSLEVIGDSAFEECEGLEGEDMPKNLQYIGDSAFLSSSLSGEIHIPVGVEYIGACAFIWNNKLITAYIESDDVRIGAGAFGEWDGDPGLVFEVSPEFALVGGAGSTAQAYVQEYDPTQKYVKFYARGTEIPLRGLLSSGMYYHCSQSEATITAFIKNDDFNGALKIPNTIHSRPVTVIGRSVFLNQGKVLSVTMPDSVHTIEKQAFCECYNMKSVTLSKGLRVIGVGAFADCYALSSIALPETVESIGDRAFWSCTGIKRIVIPPSVTYIDDRAFEDCSGLVIAGYAGSAAQTFAEENGFEFEAL